MSAGPRTASQALAYAKAQKQKPTRDWHALCLMFTRKCFGVAVKYPNAKQGWLGAKKKHPTTVMDKIPAGVPIWWETSTKNWHVAISAGNGMCYSTDVGGRGKVGYISIYALTRSWRIKFLGWSEDINGVTVYTPPKASEAPKIKKIPAYPKLFERSLVKGIRGPEVILLQKQLKQAGFLAKSTPEDENYGPRTKAAVVSFHNNHRQFRASRKDEKIGPKGWAFLFKNW